MDIDNSIGGSAHDMDASVKRRQKEQLEDLSADEIASAYSGSKVSDNIGNGNPNKLPGIPSGTHRPKQVSQMLDRNNSLSNASAGRMKEINYIEMQPQHSNNSMILDEEEEQPGHQKQVSMLP